MANKLETLIENVNALVESEDGTPTDAMMLKDTVDYLNTQEDADGAPTEAVYLLDKVTDLDNQVDDAIAKYEELNG